MRYIWIWAVLLLAGCLTVGDDPTFFESAPLRGMIYDSEGRGVFGASVVLADDDGNEAPVVQSDIQGRFTLPGVSRGEHRLVVRREGYETLQIDTAFLNRTQVVYARMVSWRALLQLANDALHDGRFGEAHGYIDRAEQAGGRQPMTGMMRAVVLHVEGDARAAEGALEAAMAGAPPGTRVPPVVQAFLQRVQGDGGEL